MDESVAELLNDSAAHVRMRIPSAIFGSNPGDVVRVGRSVAEQLLAAGAAEGVEGPLYAGQPLRPGTLVVTPPERSTT